MIYRSNRGARNTGRAVLNLGLSITAEQLHGAEPLSLSGTVVETDGHMLAALVRRVTFNQVTLATLPPPHREHTSISRGIRVSSPIEHDRANARAQFSFVTRFENRDREEFMSPFFFRVAYSIGVEDLFSNRFVLPPHPFERIETMKMFASRVQLVISSPRAPVLIRVIRRNEKSILR